MGKYSLQYRAAKRRAFNSQPLTYKPVVNSGVVASGTVASGVVASGVTSARTWQPATYTGFNAEAGKHEVRTWRGEVAQVTRIPGNGAEFGGNATGASGLLSQGFWSN